MFSCLITPVPRLFAPFTSFLIPSSPISPLSPLLPSSLPLYLTYSPPLYPYLVPCTSFPPLLEHARRHNLALARPNSADCAFLTFLIRRLVCSFVSFLSVFFFHQNNTPPFTSKSSLPCRPMHQSLVHFPSARFPRLTVLSPAFPLPPFFFFMGRLGAWCLVTLCSWPLHAVLGALPSYPTGLYPALGHCAFFCHHLISPRLVT